MRYIFGVPYLLEAGDPDSTYTVQHAKGLIWGRNHYSSYDIRGKTLVALDPVSQALYYLFDIGSPKTYISKQAADVLGIINQEAETLVHIGGHPIPAMVSPKNSHFPEANIIGMDYIAFNNVAVFLDPKKCTFKFYFGLAGKMEA